MTFAGMPDSDFLPIVLVKVIFLAIVTNSKIFDLFYYLM